jgi:hypothetical protein
MIPVMGVRHLLVAVSSLRHSGGAGYIAVGRGSLRALFCFLAWLGLFGRFLVVRIVRGG